MIRWLESLSSADQASAGGKAAQLGELAAAGLPVPPGFVLDARAYVTYVLGVPGLAKQLAGADQGDPEATEQALGPWFMQRPLPPGLEAAVGEAYSALGARMGVPEPAVAVRSSALGEDGAEASFAGQQATFLNARGLTQVLACVRACWAGLWSARTIAYRRRLPDPPAPAMAVLVQALVLPDVAGVAFTAHPVSGDRTVVVVDASWGLGEAVVSGRATPDHITLEKTTGAVLAYMVGAKQAEVVAEAHGVVERPVSPERSRARALDGPRLMTLAGLCRTVEAHFGGIPQDLEWAFAGDRAYLLQARPITALPAAPPVGGWQSPEPGVLFERRNFAEHLPGPVSPLAETLVLPAVGRELVGLARAIGFRLSEPALVTVHGYAYARGPMTPCFDLPLRVLAVYGPLFIRPAIAWERASTGPHAQRLGRLLAERPDASDGPATVAWCERLATCFATTWRDVHLLSAGWRWSEYVLQWLVRSADVSAMLQGFASPALDFEARVATLAAGFTPAVAEAVGSQDPESALRALGQEGAAALDALAALVNEGSELSAGFDPAVALPYDSLAGLARLAARSHAQGGDSDRLERRKAALAAARREAEQLAVATTHAPLRPLLRRAIRWAQGYAAVREPALATLSSGWRAMREQLLALGASLTAAGRLPDAETIFWLRWEELRSVAAGQPGPRFADLAARRALTREQAAHTPPLVLGGPAERAMGRAIAGVGASPGRVTGIARVVLGPEAFDTLAPGEILIAPATTPAWTPLFHLAAAVVTDIGGPLSHGSIVAREFKIPAVLGTESATRRLRSGEWVTVDGTLGLVWRGGG